MSQYTQYLRTVMQETGYSQAGVARNDITTMITHYGDLKPRPDTFIFNDGRRKKLVCIAGTIPVSYKGSSYNIPVAIWVMDNHPQSAPMCFVKPTASMQVRQGRHVDSSGKIYLPYLSEWRQGSHDLTGLVQVMAIVFGEEPPVVSKPPNAAPQTRPPYPNVNTPYPSPGYPPQGPPTSSYQPTNLAYPMTQPNLPYPPNSSPGYPHSSSPGYPQTSPYPSYPPGYPTPMNQQPHGNMPYPPNPGITPVNKNQISDDMMKASLKSAVNDKLKRRMKDAHAQAESELMALRQTEKELKTGQSKITDIIRELEEETAQVNTNIEILEAKNKEIEEKITAMKSKQEEMNIDEVVSPTTPLYKQIVVSFAEEQALEDSIYYLGEGLRRGSVDLDSFLKHVRSLARQQFVLRATIKLARTTAGLVNIY